MQKEYLLVQTVCGTHIDKVDTYRNLSLKEKKMIVFSPNGQEHKRTCNVSGAFTCKKKNQKPTITIKCYIKKLSIPLMKIKKSRTILFL